MANKKMRKLSCALAMAACLMGTTAPMVYADTSGYTFTVSSNAALNTDTKSKRTWKAGGEQGEQLYYATATGFDGRGTIYVHSRKLDETVSSSEVDLRSGGLNVTKHAAYNKFAAYNAYYYLKARFGASADGNHLTVVGRYTP